VSRAVCLIRQSQGTDDSVSLELQRKEIPELADELADEVDIIDLGIHTAFSIRSKEKHEKRIDSNPQIQQLLKDLRDGKYGFSRGLGLYQDLPR